MPLYEYKCLECGLHFDKLQRFGDRDLASCPNGHTRVHRLLGQPAIIFKGSGFYVTDNNGNGKSAISGSGRKPKEDGTGSKEESKKEAAPVAESSTSS